MTLNRTQRIIVSVGGCVVFLRLLFPPWITRRGGRPFSGYLIFSPPAEGGPWSAGAHVDGALLFFQIVAIVFGTVLLVWWCQTRQAITQSPSQKPNKRSILQSGTKWVAARLSDVLYGPRSDNYVALFLLLLLGLFVLAVLSGR